MRSSWSWMMLLWVLLVASGCAKAVGTAGAPKPDGLNHAGELEAEEQSCSRDIECALVEDCCGCAQGGMRMGVRSDHLDAVTERSEGVCAERTCSGVQSQHRSCTASAARCLGGRCLPAL